MSLPFHKKKIPIIMTSQLKTRIRKTTIHDTSLMMSRSYDYNRFIPDPDDVFKELNSDWSEALKLAGGEEVIYDASEAMATMIWASNALENAGSSYEVTLSLLPEVAKDQDMPATIEEDDVLYEKLVAHLSQKGSDTSYNAVQQSYRQVVQHILAMFHITDILIHRNEPLSEDLLKKTHRILTAGIDADNVEKDSSATYGGVYRTGDVGWTPFRGFAPPESIPTRMAEAITEFNTVTSAGPDAIDPFKLAAKTSHRILNIHPFLDGNSRLTRLLLNAIIQKYTGTLIPFGRDPREAAKWKETVARAAEMEGQDEEYSGGKKPWAEVATMVLIQGAREIKKFKEALRGAKEACEDGEEVDDGYYWNVDEEDDQLVKEMEKRMGWKGAAQLSEGKRDPVVGYRLESVVTLTKGS